MIFKKVTPDELRHEYGFNPPEYEDLEAYVAELNDTRNFEVRILAEKLVTSQLRKELHREQTLTFMLLALANWDKLKNNPKLNRACDGYIDSVTIVILRYANSDGDEQIEVWVFVYYGNGDMFSAVGYTREGVNLDTVILEIVTGIPYGFDNIIEQWHVQV